MAIELPAEVELVRRLVVLCIGDEGPPQTSSGKVPGLEPTNELIKLHTHPSLGKFLCLFRCSWFFGICAFTCCVSG